MDIPTYIALSALTVMVWHFTMNSSPNNFGLFQMIGVFVLGGAVGWYMDSLMAGYMISIVMSLVFVH